MSSKHKPTMRVIDIIELVSLSKEGYTLTEISQQLHIPVGTLSPILHTLKEQKYLSYHQGTQHYTLGVGIFETGSRYIQNTNAYDSIVEIMKGIVDECEETCHLATLEGGSIFYLAKVDSPNPIRMFSSIGKRIPAYGTAIGKALLKDYTKEQLIALYPQGLTPLTMHTLKDIDDLMEACRQVQNEGVAYECEESNEYIRCIAVPVYKDRAVAAALSVAIPVFRYTEKKKSQIEVLLKNAAVHVSRYVHYLNI